MGRQAFIRLTDAAEEFGVSRVKLSNLIKEGRLTTYEDPRDKRVRLLNKEELEKFFRIRPEERAGEE